MNSSKVKTQKNISAIIALALAVVTLFQASYAKSNESDSRVVSKQEAELLAEIETMLMEDEDTSIVEEVYEEMEVENTDKVKVFDANDQLVGEGSTVENQDLRSLVNTADYLTENAGQKYFRISK